MEKASELHSHEDSSSYARFLPFWKGPVIGWLSLPPLRFAIRSAVHALQIHNIVFSGSGVEFSSEGNRKIKYLPQISIEKSFSYTTDEHRSHVQDAPPPLWAGLRSEDAYTDAQEAEGFWTNRKAAEVQPWHGTHHHHPGHYVQKLINRKSIEHWHPDQSIGSSPCWLVGSSDSKGLFHVYSASLLQALREIGWLHKDNYCCWCPMKS